MPNNYLTIAYPFPITTGFEQTASLERLVIGTLTTVLDNYKGKVNYGISFDNSEGNQITITIRASKKGSLTDVLEVTEYIINRINKRPLLINGSKEAKERINAYLSKLS